MELSIISKHRTALMGIATLMILITHSSPHISMSPFWSYLISYNNIGVDIFLFLSGMGINYSLHKFYKYHTQAKCQVLRRGIMYWYSRRYMRILTPYFLIVVPLCGISMLIEGDAIPVIIYYLSTLSFWTDHTGFWFVALLLPLYIISPFLYNFLSSNGIHKLIVVSIICMSISIVPLSGDMILIRIFRNVQFVLVRLPSYILGLVLAPMINKRVKIRFKYVIMLSIFAVISLIITRHFVYTYFFMVLPCLIIFAWLLERLDKSNWYSFYTFWGNISLESYLFNGAIQIYIIWLMTYLRISDYNNILMYSMVIIGGTMLSCVANHSSKIINSNLNKYLITN